MTDSKTAVDTKPNYSVKEIAILMAKAPFDFEGAKAIGAAMTPPKSARSIVSKCANLGLPYTAKVAPVKKIAAETKLQIVSEIEKHVGVSLAGLDKSTVKALVDLRVAVRGMEIMKLSHDS